MTMTGTVSPGPSFAMRVARVTPSEISSTPSGSSYTKSGGIPSLDDPKRRVCWCNFQASAPLDRLGGRRNSLGSTSRIGWLIPASYTGQVRTASAACDRHSSGAAKFLAVELACRLIGATQREIGDRYGGITSAAVSTIRRKIRDGKYRDSGECGPNGSEAQSRQT